MSTKTARTSALKGYRVDKNGKLVPISKKLSRPAEYARKKKVRYGKGNQP